MADRFRRFPAITRDDIDSSVRRRDETEFVRLLEKHERHVYAFILSFVPSWSEADEILQETYLRLYQKIDDWDPSRSFLPWACTVARYQILTQRKKVRRERLRFRPGIVDNIAARHETEAEALDRRALALRECMKKLNVAERKLLDLAYRNELAIEELAKRSQRSVAATYKALQRIRQGLHECIDRAIRSTEQP